MPITISVADGSNPAIELVISDQDASVLAAFRSSVCEFLPRSGPVQTYLTVAQLLLGHCLEVSVMPALINWGGTPESVAAAKDTLLGLRNPALYE